jgi:predicted HTH transcriptional regulator
MKENKNIDKKSLKFLREKQTDWAELAKDCVCFANAQGGDIYIGIEDKATLPPEKQKIHDSNLPDVIQKNIAHRTINVGIAVTINTADNIKKGNGKRTKYSVNPEFIGKTNYIGKTKLNNMEDQRLEELIHKDLTAYPHRGFGEFHH